MARSSRIPAVLCLGVLLALSGCDSPTALDEAAPEPAGPAFLIGNSPLIIRLAKHTDGTRAVEYEAELNRGIFEVKTEDQFWIRSTVLFSKNGVDVVGLQPCVDKPIPLKQTELNRGGSVGIIMDIDIPFDPEWLAIIDAADGGLIDVHVKSELLLIDGAAKIHVLDTVDATEAVDPSPAN